jgi:hypothetical protein
VGSRASNPEADQPADVNEIILVNPGALPRFRYPRSCFRCPLVMFGRHGSRYVTTKSPLHVFTDCDIS